jgi:hypothetical protein
MNDFSDLISPLKTAAEGLLVFARRESIDPDYLWREMKAAGGLACRNFLRACKAGAYFPPFSIHLSPAPDPASPSQFKISDFEGRTISSGNYSPHAETLKRLQGYDGDPVKAVQRLFQLDENSPNVVWFLRTFLIPALRNRYPENFQDGADGFDFPKVKVDSKGQVLGKNGKPRRDGQQAAYEMDDWPSRVKMQYLQTMAKHWAEAFDALARWLRDEQTRLSGAVKTIESEESRAHHRPPDDDPWELGPTEFSTRSAFATATNCPVAVLRRKIKDGSVPVRGSKNGRGLLQFPLKMIPEEKRSKFIPKGK